MLERNIALTRILFYLGTLPFIAAATGQVMGVYALNMPLIACAYGAIIISFIAGMQCCMYLFFEAKCQYNLIFTSLLITLLAWATLLVNLMSIMLLVQAFSLLYLLWVDRGLKKRGLYPEWLFKIRRNVTLIAVLMLVTLAVV